MDQHTLVVTYRTKVEAVARRIQRTYRRLNIPLEDLANSGFVGLLGAAERFDPKLGVAFWTFAEYRVRGQMLNSLDEMRYLPRRIIDKSLESVEAHVADAQPRDEVASAYDLMAELTTMFVSQIESNEPSPEADIENREDAHLLWRAVAQLPTRERTVIEQHFLVGLPFTEIAKRLGIDKSGVSRLYKQASRRLRALIDESRSSQTPSEFETESERAAE